MLPEAQTSQIEVNRNQQEMEHIFYQTNQRSFSGVIFSATFKIFILSLLGFFEK